MANPTLLDALMGNAIRRVAMITTPALRRTMTCAGAVVLACTALAAAGDPATRVDLRSDQTWMEYLGQVLNPSSTQSNQFGYLTFLRGIDDVFSSPSVHDASTARFTFFNETTTLSVVNQGPLRIVTRVGTTTIYLQTTPSDFEHPDSFRAGIPVQTSYLRHVVVINTTSNAFTTYFENEVTDVTPVDFDGTTLSLGHVGDVFRTTVLGQIPSPVPPNGWIAGFATGVVRPANR
jgi:hypothetical protein